MSGLSDEQRKTLAQAFGLHDDVMIAPGNPEWSCVCGRSVGPGDEGLDERHNTHIADVLTPVVTELLAKERAAGYDEGARATVGAVGDTLLAAWQSSEEDLVAAAQLIQVAAKADYADMLAAERAAGYEAGAADAKARVVAVPTFDTVIGDVAPGSRVRVVREADIRAALEGGTK